MDPREFFGPATYERPDEFGPMNDSRGMDMGGPLGGPGGMIDPRDRDMGGPPGGLSDMLDPHDRGLGGRLGGPASEPLVRSHSRMFDPIRNQDVDIPRSSDLSPSRSDYPSLVRGDFPRDPPGGPLEPPFSPRPGEGNLFYPRNLYEDEYLSMHRETQHLPFPPWDLDGRWTPDPLYAHRATSHGECA